jgi:hypothetical protein
MLQAVAFLELFTDAEDLVAAIDGGARLDDLLGVLREGVDRMLAEGCHGPGTLAALARARDQFDTPAFRTYLAGRLGLM